VARRTREIAIGVPTDTLDIDDRLSFSNEQSGDRDRIILNLPAQNERRAQRQTPLANP